MFRDITPLAERYLAVGWALAAGLALLLVACAGDEEKPPPAATAEIERLEGESFEEIMAVALPSLQVKGEEGQLTIASAPGWSLSPLGRLIGQLDDDPSLEMATFFELQGPEGQQLPGLHLSPGVFVAFLALDRHGQLEAGGMAVLEEGRERILPLAAAEGLAPFRPGTVDQEIRLSVTPALVTDVDGDGRDEMVLAWRQDRQSLAWESYYVYQLQADGQSWQRTGDMEGEVPAQAILDYWAALAAAVSVAARWELETRLEVVWPWLVRETSPPTTEMLLELVPSGDRKEMAEVQEALDLLQSSFRQAYANLSPSFQERQPWAAFVNGHRYIEGVAIESIGSPVLKGTGRAEVEVLLALGNREGAAVHWRQFLVAVQLEMLAGRWYFDDMEAAEEKPSPG